MVLGHTSVRPTLYMKAWSSILELSKNYHMEFNFEPYVLNFFLNFGAKCEDHNNSTHLHGQNQLIIFLSISIKYLLLSLFFIGNVVIFIKWTKTTRKHVSLPLFREGTIY